jgi:hypothetical protein
MSVILKEKADAARKKLIPKKSGERYHQPRSYRWARVGLAHPKILRPTRVPTSENLRYTWKF